MQQEYIFILILSLLLFRALVIIFHEFGHAFATLLNFNGDVSVYIGSHGNPEKSFRFKIKRLECFIKYNIFKWKGGLCVPHGKNISWKGSFLISLFGPLTTLLLGIISIVFLQFINNDALFLILFAFAFSCIIDFIYNIIPKNTQIKLYDGTFTDNDGKQLVQLWKIRNIYYAYTNAYNYYVNKEYDKAGELFEKCISKISNDRELYRLAISSYLLENKYAKVLWLQETYSKKFEHIFDEYDYTNLGIVEIFKKNYKATFDAFDKAYELVSKNAIIVNNRGYAYALLDKHEEAIIDLNKAIELDKDLAYAWDNRGFSKIKLGQLEEGYIDIQKSLELNDQYSYGYLNLGVYYYHKEEYLKALELYQKALELDANTHKAQEYIDEVRAKIKSITN